MNKGLDDPRQLQKSVIAMINLLYFLCLSVCTLSFENLNEYEIHITSHSEPIFLNEYDCNVCASKFASELERERHINTEHEKQTMDPKQKCGLCPFKSETQEQLENHIVKHHSFPCEQCPSL